MVPVLEEMEMECLFFIVGTALSERPSMLWHEELYLMLVAGTAAELEIPGVLPRTSVREVAAKRTAWSALLVRLSQVDGESRLHIFNEIRSRLGLGRNWAEEFIDSNDRQRRFLLMQRSDIAKLLSSGMTIGAHSLTHTVLANMPAELARQEIAGSKSLLERNFGCSIWGFAYPFGDVSAVSSRELAIANESDYACAFVNVGGGFGATCPRYAIPRIHVRRDMSLAEFEAHLSGFHRNLQEKFSRQAR
jgi:peptidoglycan/xylan/chitin deacetylase (PgdA/CDA1 family)